MEELDKEAVKEISEKILRIGLGIIREVLMIHSRAKFQCQNVLIGMYGSRVYTFAAVCADEIPENQRFHKASPSGKLEIHVNNPDVVYEPGEFYYLDFTHAPKS